MGMKPTTIRAPGLSLQVCVPSRWTDKQVLEFAEADHPCGTENGWFIREDDDGSRVTCTKNDEMVHIVLDA